LAGRRVSRVLLSLFLFYGSKLTARKNIMSLVVKQIASIKEKVQILVPTDLGRSTKSDIVVEFRKLPVSETKSVLEAAESKELNDEEVLHQNIINIEGLLDEDKKQIEFTPDILDTLLEMEYVRRPLVSKFMEVCVGREVLKRKN